VEPDLGLADVSVVSLPGDVQSVVMRVNITGQGDDPTLEVPMRRGTDLAGFDRWSARVMTGGRGFTYSFVLRDGDAEFTTPEFQASLSADPRLDLPSWAMGATWYQIFPERFRNANPLNDPHGPGVFMMDWTADWSKPAPGEAQATTSGTVGTAATCRGSSRSWTSFASWASTRCT
jgi:hypothetical protein